VAADSEHEALEDALRQIALIDERLQARQDQATLSHFGEAEAGFSIAALLGHTSLTSAEAAVVDQLSRMPEGTGLVRTYLRLSRAPDLADPYPQADRTSGLTPKRLSRRASVAPTHYARGAGDAADTKVP
jgi:hypothetical protein